MQPIITVLGLNNTPQGPFSVAEIERKIQIGEFTLGQMAHAPGLASWAPLSEVLDFVRRSASGDGNPSAPQLGSYQAQYQVTYADFGVRLVAVLIDNVILIVINYIIGTIFQIFIYSAYNIHMPSANDLGITPDMTPEEQQQRLQDFFQKMMEAFQPIAGPYIFFTLFTNLYMFLYFAILDGMGGTVGKRAMGIIAVTADGRPLTIGLSFGRAFGRFISSCCCYIGFLFPLFNEQKKALHDFMVGSIVVKK